MKPDLVDCKEAGCNRVADADFENGVTMCLRHAASTPGTFTLLPRSDLWWMPETVQWVMPKYVSRRQLDKMRLIMKLVGAA